MTEAGRARVMVVEDEAMVRRVMVRMLERAGYEVSSHGSAEDAVDDPSAPALLVTDISLPGLSGTELARRLGERHEGLRVLYVSGYPRKKLEDDGHVVEHLLKKPFGKARFLEAVETALQSASP